ncbi:hypothetical protein EBME_0788 [bacterium endosymbiont of Mortierella elongata FMR23-6]|nr:hypothetical protein EBME_0788 [bacterium endosymbiont of Mortierella elongata FMR23-6]
MSDLQKSETMSVNRKIHQISLHTFSEKFSPAIGLDLPDRKGHFFYYSFKEK